MAKNDFKKLVKWADRAAVNLLYEGRAKAAEAVITDLQKLGPIWTGQFSNSWRLNTSIGSKSGGSGQKGQPVPVKAPSLSGADVRNKLLGSPFSVDNTANYAGIATDKETGKFINPNEKPLNQDRVSYGNRSRGFRGEPYPNAGSKGIEGPNRATAPLDWFENYLKGGGVDKAVEKAMNKAAKRFK